MAGIRVSGIDELVTTEKLLTIYFGKKTGGGKIREIYFPLINNDAVIIFENENVVDTVLSYESHVLCGVTVQVTKLPPMVFSEVEAKLETDYSSIVLATDIKDELELWAHTKIRVISDYCVLCGNWYQIERAWQIINKAQNTQQKIQYNLQRQNSVDRERKWEYHGKQNGRNDQDDLETDTPVARKTSVDPRHSKRKMQESYSSVGDTQDTWTDSIISQNPFENSVFNEVRRMQHEEENGMESLYSSHKYSVGRDRSREGSFDNKSGRLAASEHLRSLQMSNGSLMTNGDDQPLVGPSGVQTSTDEDLRMTRALREAQYDEMFPRVNIGTVDKQGGDVPSFAKNTYTVRRDANKQQSNSFDSEEESATPTRSLLDGVNMHSDDDSETELKTTSGSYQHHRYQDQNDTFMSFSQPSKQKLPQLDDQQPHSLPIMSSGRTGGVGKYKIEREIKPGSDAYNSSDGIISGDHSLMGSKAHTTDNSTSTWPTSSDQEEPDERNSLQNLGATNSRPQVFARDQRENIDLPPYSRSKDTFSGKLGYGRLTPIISSSELIGQNDDGLDDLSRYEFSVGSLKIVIYHGDITKATTRGIVNAANGYLAHGAGVAGAISMAAGHTMTRECKEIIDREGVLETGTVVHTQGGGALHSNVAYVLHAVGPIWIEALRERCNFEMIVTYLNCFKYAERIWLDSITLPCISAGIFGCPLDLSIQSFVDALLLFNSDLTDRHHVEEIHLVNNDPDAVLTSIVLLRSIMENGQDHATAQALNRFNMLSKKHGERLGERLSKTFRDRMQIKDDGDVRSNHKHSAAVRRSSSLNRLPKKKNSSEDFERSYTSSSAYTGSYVGSSTNSGTLVGSSTNSGRLTGSSSNSAKYTTGSDVLSASKVSLREKSGVMSSGASNRSGSLSARSYRPSSADRGRSSSASRLTVGTHSIRDSSSTALTSDSVDDFTESSSVGNDRLSRSRDKRQTVGDRLYNQSTVSSNAHTSGYKKTPAMKQALVSTHSGAKPKTSSQRIGTKTTPLKATPTSSYNNEDNYRSRNFDGSKTLPMNGRPFSGSRRGSSPRRH